MKKLLVPACAILAVAGAFLAGTRYAGGPSPQGVAAAGRAILYYVDPMNPSHTSDRPGLAPCGMKMEPVYADEAGGRAHPPGTVRVNVEKQQLIGVKVAVVETRAWSQPLRFLGKVAVDETRLYRINGPVDGWTTKVMPVAPGSRVGKDETLARYYSTTVAAAGSALVSAVEYQDQVTATGDPAVASRANTGRFNLEQFRDTLRDYGVSEAQIADMIRSRDFSEEVNIVSPVDGFVLARSVSEGQRFMKGSELFRVVDLSRVWILVDVFEREAGLIPAETQVRIAAPGPGRVLAGTLSTALPQFDNSSRTLKLRFEAENPDFVLKPDMFVDVEVPIRLPETVVVPAEAVLDSGMRQTVFVDRGEGYFEPRSVRTGWRVGDQRQVIHGLQAGERIVVSGNFLLDSESRMKLAAGGVHGTPGRDPVCGMAVDEAKAKAAGLVSEREGRTASFCSAECKATFDADPARYLGPPSVPLAEPAAGSQERAKDPVCGMTVDTARARTAGHTTEHDGRVYYFCRAGCKADFDERPGAYLPPAARPDDAAAAQAPAHDLRSAPPHDQPHH